MALTKAVEFLLALVEARAYAGAHLVEDGNALMEKVRFSRWARCGRWIDALAVGSPGNPKIWSSRWEEVDRRKVRNAAVAVVARDPTCSAGRITIAEDVATEPEVVAELS